MLRGIIIYIYILYIYIYTHYTYITSIYVCILCFYIMLFTYIYICIIYHLHTHIYIMSASLSPNKWHSVRNDLYSYVVFSHWRGLKWFPQYEINILRSLGWVTWSETLAGQTVNFDSGELENALTALFLSTRMSWMMMKWKTKRPTRQTKMKWSSLREKHRKTAQKAWISQMSILFVRFQRCRLCVSC